MNTFNLKNFKILSTGADGGHSYISVEVEYNGLKRKMAVLFKNKSDEKKLNGLNTIRLKGILMDEGLEHSLMLLDSEIVE